MFRLNPYKWFIIAVLYSGFLSYVFNSGVVAYGLIILMAIIILINECSRQGKIKRQHLFCTLMWMPYVLWAGLAYISKPLHGEYLSAHFLAILILPILSLSCLRLFLSPNSEQNYHWIYRILLVFVLIQMLVCLGQISTFVLGIGFPVNELYVDSGMITGTFFNSNDLAAVMLSILFFVLGLEKYYFRDDRHLFWFLVFILLLIAGSRSALLISMLLFILAKANNPRKILSYSFIVLTVFSLFIFIVGNFDNQVVSRFSTRFESLLYVMQYGVSYDSSMNVRLASYLHYLEKFPELGLGSMEINNYFKYSNSATFNANGLLFENPHSLVVELGYWLGWPGLLFFFLPLFFLLKFSKRKFLLLVVFLIVSTIPSSILGSMLFFMILILCFFDYRSIDSVSKIELRY